MKRIAISLLIGIVALVAAVWIALKNASVQDWLFRRTAEHELSRPAPVLADKNELSALLVGTGSPLPDKTRGGPSTLIAVGDKYYLVDTGLDTARDLILWRIPLQNVAGVFLTHFHSDHIGDLGEVRLQTWVAGRNAPLAVYGPPGVDRVVNGFNEAYALDDRYRTKHHGAAMLPPDAVTMVPKPIMPGVVFEKDGLKVTAILVHHHPSDPAYGYRFDFRGRSIVIRGDTSPDEGLAHAAKGAECLSTKA
jgi:ribonuclease Z